MLTLNLFHSRTHHTHEFLTGQEIVGALHDLENN